MKSSLGSKTYDGISSQPDVWRNILNGSKKQLDKAKPFSNISRPERIILTGCGITYAPSVGAAKIIRR